MAVGIPEPYSNWMVPETVDGLTVAPSVTRVPEGCGPVGLTVSVVTVGVSGLMV
jgi:hypothetical protein